MSEGRARVKGEGVLVRDGDLGENRKAVSNH